MIAVLGLLVNHYGYSKFTIPQEHWQAMSHALTISGMPTPERMPVM